MSAPVACTIVANNYLAYARVLAESFRARHPDGTFHVLVVDRRDPDIDYAREPFVCWFVEELGIPSFPQLAFGYSILELSTAVKPWFLRHLHERTGCAAAVYFDPDILVLGDLDPLYRRLAEADVVLTPHVTAPLEDTATPGERDFLLSGIYNLGFVGFAFNERTLPFLDWWHRRLSRHCLHAIERGLFVDQRWMDFAPAFLDRVAILREPGWNVAYWNLPLHRLEQRDGSWWIDGQPLRFFHFSGYALERPDLISRFQNRFTFAQRPDVAPLFADYARRLRAAGHVEAQRLAYAFGHFDNGTPVPVLARQLLREVDPEGRRWPDPFRTAGEDSFFGWMTSADDPRSEPFLPKLAVTLWEARPDLRQVFPALRGPSRHAFARWLVGHGDHGLGRELLAPVEASLRPPAGTPAAGLEAMQRRVWHTLARHGAISFEALRADEIASLVTEAGPVEGASPRFARLGLILHRMRADLQASFPDPAGADRLAFALWFVTSGRREYDLSWSLWRPVWWSLGPREAAWALAWGAKHWWEQRRQGRARREANRQPLLEPELQPPPALPSSGPDGVNVIGWATAPTGVGEACRGTLAALEAAEVPHALWSLGTHAFEDFRSGAAGGAGGDGAPFEIDLLHVNADMMEEVTGRVPHWVTSGRHRIGYWFWELSHFPLAFAPAFDHVDEVWAPSRFCLEAYTTLSPVPVRWMPPSVPPRQMVPRSRGELGVDSSRFLYLFAFDARSVPERKNPLALLDAFALAAAASPRPMHLLVKVNHGEEALDLLAEMRERARRLPVTLSTAAMGRSEIDSLIGGCDAFVSLHRSEGLGLPLIEAMQWERPVVATGYGGCCDFLDDAVGWVVRHSLVPLRQAHGPYPAGALWAEPDVAHAAEQMVRVATEAGTRARKAEAARRRVLELYAPAAAGERFRRELDRIRASRSGPRLVARRTGAGVVVAEGLGAAAAPTARRQLRPRP
jgi:glycosyltransferase involved in cell wall biosynthesis